MSSNITQKWPVYNNIVHGGRGGGVTLRYIPPPFTPRGTPTRTPMRKPCVPSSAHPGNCTTTHTCMLNIGLKKHTPDVRTIMIYCKPKAGVWRRIDRISARETARMVYKFLSVKRYPTNPTKYYLATN